MRAVFFSLVILTASTPAFGQAGAPAKPAAGQDANGAPAAKPSPDMTLRDAYKREFAFLAGQKRQLELRLERVGKNAASEARQVQSAIDAAEAKLLRLESRTKALQEELLLAEQAQQSSSDDKQLVDATLEQSESTLKDYGITFDKPAEGTTKEQQLQGRFEKAVELLQKLASTYKEQGEYFLQDGTKTNGTIVRVGRIAAYGVSDQGSGVLAPAGDGKLKVWRDAASEDAVALNSGSVGETVAIFLYESLDARVDDSEEETPVEHVDSGGSPSLGSSSASACSVCCSPASARSC